MRVVDKALSKKCQEEEEIHLTVMKTSLFFAGDGFSVYDSNARLVFRVDSCGGSRELVLMDPRGRCLFSLRRKRPSLHQRWEGFAGEIKDDGGPAKPHFSVRRSSVIGRSPFTVEVYTPDGHHEEFQIEGSFAHRSCTVYESSGRSPVAEIRRKVDSGVILGKDVFTLAVKPRIGAALAMAVVLAVDRIAAGDDVDGPDAPASGAVHSVGY